MAKVLRRASCLVALDARFWAGLYTHFVRPPSGPAKAVQRKHCRCDLGSPFLWIAFFWRSKRKYLAKGETLCLLPESSAVSEAEFVQAVGYLKSMCESMIISSCEGVNDDFCRFVLNNKQHLSFYDAVFAALFITLIVFWGYRYFKRIHEEVRKTKDVRTAFKVIGKSLAWLWLYVIVALSVFSVFAYLAIFYAAHNGEGLSTDPAVWGQAGDFFGGMLNPFLAFCSFMALLYTIRIQSEELRLTREELTKSSSL